MSQTQKTRLSFYAQYGLYFYTHYVWNGESLTFPNLLGRAVGLRVQLKQIKIRESRVFFERLLLAFIFYLSCFYCLHLTF